jgi:hypothetical protein
VEADSILLLWLRCHENRLVNVGVELLASLAGVESLQTVLLQCVDQDAISHLDAVVQSNQIGVSVWLELVSWHGAKSTVEVVDGFYEVAGEALDGEVFRGLCFAGCAFLEVAEVGD